MNKKTIRDIDLKGKKVFVRCDFNVPMNEEREITDNTRIVAALPTIKYLLEQKCKIILASHLGRPKGEVKPEYSLAPVAKELSRLLNKEVIMAKDVIGPDATEKAKNLKEGEILLLENVRNSKLFTSSIRIFNRKRTKIFRRCIKQPRKTICSNIRRSKSIRQNRSNRQPIRKSRYINNWRRNGIYILQSTRI